MISSGVKYLSAGIFHLRVYNLALCVKGRFNVRRITSRRSRPPNIPESFAVKIWLYRMFRSDPTNNSEIQGLIERLRTMLEGADTSDAQILRNDTTIFIAPSRTFKSFYQGLLALVDPGKIIQICKTRATDKVQTHHLTECASFSSTTLTVVHENRTSEGNPNV